MLWGNGYSAGSLHGDQTQDLRFSIMDKFREGDIKVLVATDVASRGLDIEAVARVINYDVPEESESYVHRIGRTGRANLTGIAITLVAPKERRYWDQILKDTKFKIASLEREEGRRMGNNREGGEGSGSRGEGSRDKPRKQRRRRGRGGKGGNGGGGGDGDGRQGQSRGRGRQGSSGRDEGEGSRRKRSSRGRRGKGAGGGPKLPKMEPEFGSMEEMEETLAEVKNQNEEKKKRQQSRPEKITLDVVDDDYLKEDYFNIDAEVLKRADSVSPRKKRGQEEKEEKGSGEGGRRRRRRRSRSGGGGRKKQGGGGRSGGEQQSAEGSQRKPRRRRRRRGGGGGGSGGSGGGGGGGGSGGGS
jgi:ATP-dependent RNA helicase DeaD